MAIKCDWCGQYIPYKDLMNGDAKRILKTPDSAYTTEQYESVCRKCNWVAANIEKVEKGGE